MNPLQQWLRRIPLALAAAAIAAGPATALAADAWPSRPVTIVVPFAPGGNTDMMARMMAERMSKIFGKPFIVDNKGGAAGTIAAEQVARAQPDGYTLFMATMTQIVTAPMTNKIRYDPIRDLAPIVNVGGNPFVLAVNPQRNFRTVTDLVNYAKANPGKLNYATNGVGTSAHFTSELFNLQAGTKVIHIPYRSSGEVISGLRNGDVHMAFANAPAVNALVKAGTLRAIAVTSANRTKELPDVPTMVESGMPDFVVTSWLGAYAAAGTPADVVRKLGEVIVRGAQQPENVQRFETVGFQVSTKDAAAYAAFNRAELARWKEVARLANIRAEG